MMDDDPLSDELTRRIASPQSEKVRETWKFVKKKHETALKTKKIQFKQELGPMLDKRATLWSEFNKLAGKRKQIKDDFNEASSEVKGTDKEWSKETRAKKLAEANKASDAVKVKVKAKLAEVEKHANALKLVVKDYKVKVKGLGNPAEQELNRVLDDITQRADEDIKQAKFRNE